MQRNTFISCICVSSCIIPDSPFSGIFLMSALIKYWLSATPKTHSLQSLTGTSFALLRSAAKKNMGLS